jgi:hypothetical protein
VFQKLCSWCGLAYIVGGIEEAIDRLVQLKLVTRAAITVKRTAP